MRLEEQLEDNIEVVQKPSNLKRNLIFAGIGVGLLAIGGITAKYVLSPSSNLSSYSFSGSELSESKRGTNNQYGYKKNTCPIKIGNNCYEP